MPLFRLIDQRLGPFATIIDQHTHFCCSNHGKNLIRHMYTPHIKGPTNWEISYEKMSIGFLVNLREMLPFSTLKAKSQLDK